LLTYKHSKQNNICIKTKIKSQNHLKAVVLR